ncbi:putative adhesin [Cohnella sp. SGD-V74]|jgi:Uncharacterized conserved protein|uniref:DUF4097 family beta strand repeat-containing protein n=1 Tax=unclassified Cohnella TaxID=2636738 RepID=UPI000D41DD73|nr:MULTISPECIES: DUF4097 family beta strand repeat-containing protein [unclassified Cohnella]PRX71125.1 putative adhesin [Cohnella sp. SGD-V74]
MRKFWYFTAFCLIVIGIAGALNHNWNTVDKDMRDFEKKWTFSAEELRNLSIKSEYNVSMTFVKSSDGVNSIHLKGRGTEQMIETIQAAEISGSKLDLELIRLPRRYMNLFGFNFDSPTEQFVVSVTDDALLDKLKLKLDSGNLELKNASLLRISSAVLDSDSGNMSLGEFASDTLEIDVDSGNVKAERVTANLTASIDSGNITIENMTGKAKLSADSGNVKLYKLDSSDTSISVDSGNAYVRVPADFAGVYDLKADSGRVRAPESRRQTNDTIKVRTDSGNITIEEAPR